MEAQYATKEDFWRLQETISDISTTQAQHSERIMRLEKRRDEDSRLKNVWTPSSPFTSMLGGGSQNGESLSPCLVVQAANTFQSRRSTQQQKHSGISTVNLRQG